MFKLIMHGGNSKKSFVENSDFVFELSAKKIIKKVLIVLYARENNEWEKIFVDIKNRFIFSFPNQKILFELSSDDINIFLKQIMSSDLIFFTGGSEILLISKIKKIANKMIKALNNKVVAGVSAGANIFSSYYYSNDRRQIEKGLGVLKIKTICHYSEEKRNRLHKLSDFNNLPVLVLKGEDYVVFYVE